MIQTKYLAKLTIIASFITFSSCNQRNNLNTSEEELINQIEKQEEKSENATNVPIPDTVPSGFRFQEDRSIDPNNPPILIDIVGSQNNVEEIKLSDIASKIKYIKLETPPDSSLLFKHPKFNTKTLSVFSDDNNIITQSIFGIARYNMNGEFQETIWKNESGFHVDYNSYRWTPHEFYGIMPNNNISIFNGKLFIRFNDGANRQVQIIKQELNSQLQSSSELEFQRDSIKGKRMLTIKEKFMSRSFGKIYGLSSNSWVGVQDGMESALRGHAFVVFNNRGDTLCAFSPPYKAKNWEKSLFRAIGSFTYYYKNRLTYLDQFGDTIFRLIPPNRLLPVYVLNFGKDKVGYPEGLNTDIDLSQKLMPYSIFETQNHLLITYTRNYAGPKDLQEEKVIFYSTLFDKKENKLYHSPNQTKTVQKLINDIDGGLNFLPEFVTPEGNMLMLVSGEKIKEYINSIEFENKVMDESQKQRHKQMADELKNNDWIIMIAK